MDSNEIREKFLDFFEKRGHKIVPSSFLVSDDPSVLLTTAGMQQFKPYYTGQKNALSDFNSQRTCSIQKSFRTSDIDEVGDESHLTFFEMPGNFSFGPIGNDEPGNFGKDGYFKKSAIFWAREFITKEMGLKIDYVSIFGGEVGIPRDNESEKIWEEIDPNIEVRETGRKDNFWGPTGKEGPCGPTTEIYVNGVEIWNIVFNEYYCDFSGKFAKLENPGVDTGMGLERLAMALQKKNNVFETDLFEPLIAELRGTSTRNRAERNHRIIADHIRGSVFLVADGVLPSNVEAGYILRRILRRAIRYAKLLGLPRDFYISLAQKVIENYGDFYPGLKNKQADIITVLRNEDEKFSKTLEKGLKEFENIIRRKTTVVPKSGEGLGTPFLKSGVSGKRKISGKEAFDLFSTYGFPLELIKELAEEQKFRVDEFGFEEELKKHQEISRAGAEKKFGGVGKKAGEKEARLHTATHLLHQALRDVLGKYVKQMGSDITIERLRFDFFHSEKMTPEQIKKIEDIVNEKIKEDLPVTKEEMSYEEAIKSGALAFFKEKYPGKVNVYSVGDYSKEICAGPHAKRTGELGEFKIIKEESSGAGVRRIRAILSR